MTSFIDKLAPFAQHHGPPGGILPSLIIAQGILESGSGTSVLAVEANNLFGIKKGVGWTGPVYARNSSEWSEEKGWYSAVSEFRKYDSFEGCVIDLVEFYQRDRYKAVRGQTDFLAAATAAWTAGYATDPNYPQKLWNIYNQHNLSRFETAIAGDKKEVEQMAVQDIRSRTKRTNGTRALASVTHLARHHSGTATGDFDTFWRHWNGTLGWGTGGYHEIILRDGTVQLCYNPNEITNGVGGQNSYTYHICVVGNGSFTAAQERAWEERAIFNMKRLNIQVNRVLGHREFPGQNTACPGINMVTVRNRINSLLLAPAPVPVSQPNNWYRVRKSWADVASQEGAFLDPNEAKLLADKLKDQGYKVFAPTGVLFYDPKPPVIVPVVADRWWRVRKTWKNVASQISAHNDPENAIAAAEARKSEGFVVFDDAGRAVHIPSQGYGITAADRLGEAELSADSPYYILPDGDSYQRQILEKGRGSDGNMHYYEIRNGWVRLGVGWVPQQVVIIRKDYAEDRKRTALIDEAIKLGYVKRADLQKTDTVENIIVQIMQAKK